MAQFDSLDHTMKCQTNDDNGCTSIIVDHGDSKIPPRTGPLHLSYTCVFPSSRLVNDNNIATFTDDDDDNVLLNSKPSAASAGMACAARPQWWSARTTLSRRSLMEVEEEDLRRDMTATPTKRKASHSLLDDDDDDCEHDSDDCIARNMRLSIPSAFRSSKIPRRCHSMFSSIPSQSLAALEQKNDDVTVDDDDGVLPPPLGLTSDGSLSASTTSRTVTDSSSLLDGLKDDDEDDVAIQASMMSRPVLQRSSTIKNAFDLATSIESFRTRLSEQECSCNSRVNNHDEEDLRY